MFGERTKVPHGSPVCHPIRNNEPAMIEIGGLKHGYAVGLVEALCSVGILRPDLCTPYRLKASRRRLL